MNRLEQITQRLKFLPDRWVRQVDQYLLLHFPALWKHGYGQIFSSILKEVLPAYIGLLILAFLGIGSGAAFIAILILLVGIPILGLKWLYNIIEKEKEVYGRVVQLGLGDLYHSKKEDRIHLWANFGLVALSQFHPFLIFTLLLGSVQVLWHSATSQDDTPSKPEPTALTLSDHRYTQMDSAVTGFVQNEYHYYVFEKGMQADLAFQLVYDSLQAQADTLRIGITDSRKLKEILLQTGTSDTTFLHYYRYFLSSKAQNSILMDTTWQTKHYLPRQSWQRLSNQLDNDLKANRLWSDVGYLALFLALLLYRFFISMTLRDMYFMDLILLHVAIPETFLRKFIRKTTRWFILILFACILIYVFARLIPENFVLQYWLQCLSKVYYATQGKLPGILFGYLLFLTICTLINYFVFFPKVRRQITIERFSPGEIPYYKVTPLKNSTKRWVEKISNAKVRQAYLALMQQKLSAWSASLLSFNPELWRRSAVYFTYELWLLMSAGLLLMISLFGIVQFLIKVSGLSENWIFDYLAVVEVALWALPTLIAFYLYLINLVKNPKDCLLTDKTNWSFNFKLEKWVGGWLIILITSLFFYRKIGLYIFLGLINITSGKNISLVEMNANLGVIQLSEFGKQEGVMNWQVREVALREYWYLTHIENRDSLTAVDIIRDSMLEKLDGRYWAKSDITPKPWWFKRQDVFSLQQNYLRLSELPAEHPLHQFIAFKKERKNNSEIIWRLNEYRLSESKNMIDAGGFFHLFILVVLATAFYFEDAFRKEIPLKIWKHLKKYRIGLVVFVYFFILLPVLALLAEKIGIVKTEDAWLQVFYYPIKQLGNLLDVIFTALSFPAFAVLALIWLVYLLPRIKRIIYQDFSEPV